MSPARWARGRWNVLRARRPRTAGALETGVLGLRGSARLVDEVRLLRTRLAALERDHALLAAHVAALVEAAPGGAQPEPSVEAVRLSAVAFYEQRIAALEERLPSRGHARRAPGSGSARRTSGDRRENAT
ncbi:MAG: hypothetical protein ACTHJL_13010 [Amnibacterium sp.]